MLKKRSLRTSYLFLIVFIITLLWTLSLDSFDKFQALQFSPNCGNNIIETEEQCDDGNDVNGDGCSASCQIETPQCASGADTNRNDIINQDELNSYIQEYYMENINIDKLSNAIVEHLNEC